MLGLHDGGQIRETQGNGTTSRRVESLDILDLPGGIREEERNIERGLIAYKILETGSKPSYASSNTRPLVILSILFADFTSRVCIYGAAEESIFSRCVGLVLATTTGWLFLGFSCG